MNEHGDYQYFMKDEEDNSKYRYLYYRYEDFEKYFNGNKTDEEVLLAFFTKTKRKK